MIPWYCVCIMPEKWGPTADSIILYRIWLSATAYPFRESLEQLNELKIAVVGISPDKPEALAKFQRS